MTEVEMTWDKAFTHFKSRATLLHSERKGAEHIKLYRIDSGIIFDWFNKHNIPIPPLIVSYVTDSVAAEWKARFAFEQISDEMLMLFKLKFL